MLPLPDGLSGEILSAIEKNGRKLPKEKLARWVLRKLFWKRWTKRAAIAAFLMTVAGAVVWRIEAARGYSGAIAQMILWSSRFEVWKYSEEARPWNGRLKASDISSAADLYRTTNVWPVHLEFTRAQWSALDAKKIEMLPNFLTTNGQILLRNPKAPRSGLAGVMGYAFDWSEGNLEFGGKRFENVGVRIKGNVGALIEPKHPFKLDLNRFVKTQKLAGLDELTLNNLLWDNSCLRDALAYELFRDVGTPASRTAYAWVTATVEKKWNRKPLGLYLLLEPVDEQFARERFGSKKTPIFKPVTYNLFEYLGDDWDRYAAIYDLKTKASPAERRRIIDFSRLVSNADDAEFETRVGEFLDLDEFARFLGVQVLLASYDGLLTTGQNFYMYIDPRSTKLGFIPWDLDCAWGNFWIAGKSQLQRASIWHPWSGPNRFVERVLATAEFRAIYRARLEEMLNRLFTPERIQRRIDEIAAVLRGPVGAESKFRLNKFEQEVGIKPVNASPGETEFGINQVAYPYKKFVEVRARSVRQQLDGKSKGLIVPPISERF
jgi:hypothetical protein